MPQGEIFWNPYRMIPVKDKVDRKRPVTDEKFSGTSGIIRCRLTSLTLFLVGRDSKRTGFMTRNGQPVVAGSSLKGMLRSLAEIVGGGCCVTASVEDCKPAGYLRACDDNRMLCPTCRMFGMVGKGNDMVHKGRVAIGDALLQGERPCPVSMQIALDRPKPRHTAFYLNPVSGKQDGCFRKLYFHQPKAKDALPSIGKWGTAPKELQAIPAGHDFLFEVRFTSLEDDELALLLYVLALEDEVEVRVGEEGRVLRGPMCHKLGYAKSLGLGSCRIDVEELVLLPRPQDRFASMANDGRKILAGQALREEILGRTKLFRQDDSPTMQHLRKMLLWDESDGRQFSYPTHHWFNTEGNSRKTLKPL